jgi:hypothetical protein
VPEIQIWPLNIKILLLVKPLLELWGNDEASKRSGEVWLSYTPLKNAIHQNSPMKSIIILNLRDARL